MTVATTEFDGVSDLSDDVLRPEERLFFLLAPPKAETGAVKALASCPIDWGRLTSLAVEEGALSTMFRTLARAGVEVPASVGGPLHEMSVLSDFRLLHVRRLLEKLLGALAEAGIDVLVVKGVGLSAYVYADPTERNMADLDVVVPPADGERAQALARSLGWLDVYAPEKGALYEDHHHLPPLRDADGVDIRLEIHTDVFPPSHPLRYGLPEIRRRARRVRIGAAEVAAPSAEDLLVYACAHLAWSHEMTVGGWKTLRDVAAITAHPDFSWERFLSIARDPTLAPLAYWTLRMAVVLAQVSVPSDVLVALRPALFPGSEGVLVRHFARQLVPGQGVNPSEALARWLWGAAMRPGRAGYGGQRPWQHADKRIEQSRATEEVAAQAEAPVLWWRRWSGYGRFLGYVRLLLRGGSPRDVQRRA